MAEDDQCMGQECWPNATHNDSFDGNATSNMRAITIASSAFYILICFVGLVGNFLVIMAVLRHPKMKTVTNIYILNLAVADSCFLIGLPFLIATALSETWVFGFYMCKVFYFLTSINWFCSVFTLTVMSADRYMAVCHPVRSMRYRTRFVALLVCSCVWCVSLLVMLPIILYSTTVPSENGGQRCTISWPEGQPIPAEMAFIWYSMLVGFGIPVPLICVFYALLVMRLRTVGPKKKSKEKKKTHRHVTVMVLTVIAVYIICWLPYWVFQVYLTFTPAEYIPKFVFHAFLVITILSYANSALNPLLYAFLSDNFRKSFASQFKCMSASEANNALQVEHSMFPHRRSGQTTAVTALSTNGSRTTNTLLSTEKNVSLPLAHSFNKGDEEGQIQEESTKFIVANHNDVYKDNKDQPTEL